MSFTFQCEIVAFLVLAYHDEGAVHIAFELHFPHDVGGDQFFVFIESECSIGGLAELFDPVDDLEKVIEVLEVEADFFGHVL